MQHDYSEKIIDQNRQRTIICLTLMYKKIADLQKKFGEIIWLCMVLGRGMAI